MSTRTDLPGPALAALLERSAAGDVAAFRELYDATCAAVWRLERCRHHDPVAAATAVRRRYRAAWAQAAGQPSSGLSPRAWLLSLDLGDRPSAPARVAS